MSEGYVRHCPRCGQALRFPAGIGGMLMACPNCGHHFVSPFRLAEPDKAAPASPPPAIPPVPREAAPPEAAPAPKVVQNSLAARVAALYAANTSSSR